MLLLNIEALLADFNGSREIWTLGSENFRNELNLLSSSEIIILLLEAITNMLTEEMLVRSLYPILNGEYIESIQSPFSHSTQNSVSAQLSSIERLLTETTADDGSSLGSVLTFLSSRFEEFFYQNFDASKECLILFYSTLDATEESTISTDAEFEIAECINLLTLSLIHI